MYINDMPELRAETPRLIVRRLNLGDAPGLFRMMSDADTCSDDGGYAPVKVMDDAFMATVARFAGEPGRYAIVRRQDGETVGTIHIMAPLFERAVPCAEIGFCIVPGCRRQGYAYEAVRAMLKLCHRAPERGGLGLPLVLAGAFEFNAASQRLLEKLGFVREGVTHWADNHPRYGLTDMINYYHAAPERGSGNEVHMQ